MKILIPHPKEKSRKSLEKTVRLAEIGEGPSYGIEIPTQSRGMFMKQRNSIWLCYKGECHARRGKSLFDIERRIIGQFQGARLALFDTI
jgi:hypothetical protein